MSLSERLFLFAILLVAVVLRSWDLEIKPPHFDEGINGHFVARIWKEGFYDYDPTNFHGPLYFYILQFAELVFGKGIFGYRFVTGLLSIAMIVMVAAHRRFVGRAALWAAALLAISPAFVFYSRYAIHETLFILTQAAFTYGFFLYRQTKSKESIGFMTFGFFGAVATKETFLIFFGTWAIAILCVRIGEKILPAKPSSLMPSPALPARRDDTIAIVLIGLFFCLGLFSGFFAQPQALGEMFSAFAVWTKTGTSATGHEKAFLYWVDLMKGYEWPFLASLLLSPWVFFRSGREVRLLAVTGFGLWLAYSLVPYKTPWCILSAVWPLSFVFGRLMSRGAAFFSFEKFKFPMMRPIAIVVLLGLLVHSINATLRLNFKDFANPKEAYVYVQTTMEFKKVTDVIDRLVKDQPEKQNMRLSVLNKDPWPMPYVFMDFPLLMWGNALHGNVALADVILFDAVDTGVIESRIQRDYFILPFQIRDAYQMGTAYLNVEIFKDYLPADTPIAKRKAVEP